MLSEKLLLKLVKLQLILILPVISDPNPIAEPKSFTDDPYVDDEKFREKVTKHEVVAVSGEKTAIPCDCTPTSNHADDKPVLILWYKDQAKLPIYSFDLRSSSGQHWKDINTLGERGYVYFEESPKTDYTSSQSSVNGKVWKSSLNIDPVEPTDAGRYRCRVDFDISPTRNTRIKLKLVVRPTKPVIYSDDGQILEFRTMPVPEGSDLKLYCKTKHGDPTPTISWRKNQVPLNPVGLDTDAVTGRVISTIFLRNLDRSDQGAVVSCSVENSDLIATQSVNVRIDILFPPVRAKIVREWSFFTVGKKYNVSCQVLGSRPSPITQLWVGSRPIKTVSTKASIDGNISTTIGDFVPSKDDDQKFLSCQARNKLIDNVSVEDQWKISVHYKPDVTLSQDGESEIIKEGDDVSLKCTILANPLYHTIVWTKQGVNLEEVSSKNVHILDETLYINSITEEQNGEYGCSATNQAGTGYSNTLALKVAMAPSCLNNNSTTVIEMSLHEETEILCSMKWASELKFRWMMKSKDFGETVDFPKAQFTEEGPDSKLRFSPRSTSDYGDIVCMATNSNGEGGQPCSYQIKIRGDPPMIFNECNTFNQTYTSFTIDCSMKETSNKNLFFQFEIKNAHSQRIIRNISTAAPKLTVEDLQPSSDFIISVYSYINGQKSKPYKLEGFTTRSGEKQLATKPELESRNPLKLIPILGALMLISLVLVLITIAIVALVRRKIIGARNSPSSQLELINSQKQDMDYSPDLIPKDSGYGYCQSLEDLRYKNIERPKDINSRPLAKENTFNKNEKNKSSGSECSYAELAFPTSSEKALLVHNNDNYHGTEYAHIVTSNIVGSEIPATTKLHHISDLQRKGEDSFLNPDNIIHHPSSSLSLDVAPSEYQEKYSTIARVERIHQVPNTDFDRVDRYSGTLKRVKFLDQDKCSGDFERHSLPRNHKDKIHLCPMHKHKLSSLPAKALETVKEAENVEKLSEKEESIGVDETTVPYQSFKDVEFKL